MGWCYVFIVSSSSSSCYFFFTNWTRVYFIFMYLLIDTYLFSFRFVDHLNGINCWPWKCYGGRGRRREGRRGRKGARGRNEKIDLSDYFVNIWIWFRWFGKWVPLLSVCMCARPSVRPGVYNIGKGYGIFGPYLFCLGFVGFYEMSRMGIRVFWGFT